MPPHSSFLPALRFRFLAPVYDLISRTTREFTFKRRLIALVDENRIDQVLDVGCGTGTLACMIKAIHPETALTAVDCDATILKIAHKKAEKRQLEIEFREAFSEQLPFADEYFGTCFSTLFFHHLDRKQKQKTLSEIFRVLCKNGDLLIGDWGKPTNLLMRALSLPVRFFDGDAVTRDNLNGLLPELVAAAGFQQVKVVARIGTIFGTLDLIRGVKP